MSAHPPVGVVFGSITPPEHIAGVARRAEELGFDELWFSEDCFFSGGMAGVAQVLASTTTVPVGTGAVSAMTRHPAVSAMEFAGLLRMYPGRVRPGVALGVRPWLEQMGLMPSLPLTALRETVTVLRALLAGEEVTIKGEGHRLDRIKLDYPPATVPPIHVGAVNERALRLSGEIADGTILSVLATPEYVRWARGLVGGGRRGRAAPHHDVRALRRRPGRVRRSRVRSRGGCDVPGRGGEQRPRQDSGPCGRARRPPGRR